MRGMDPTARPYRGVSAVERAARRRADLLEAGLGVVGHDGVAGTTVGAVCERARLTKRYFYENFATLDALLVELLDEVFTRLRAAMTESIAAAGDGPERRARAVAGVLVDRLRADPRWARLYTEAPANPALARRREQGFAEFAELLVDGVLGAGRERWFAALVVVAGVTHAVAAWLRDEVPLDRDDLVEEIVRIGLAAAG